MLGWINDCVEKLVIEKFGLEAWHTIRAKTESCKDFKDGGFLKLEHYHDKSTIELVGAICEYTGLTAEQAIEAAGEYFVPYIINEGYGDLLCCQGNNLRHWLNNINAIHQHLQTTFPKKMTMPEFWCEDNRDGTITLFYFSSRGNILAPLAVGIVNEVAKRQFELDIVMDQVTTQGVNGARFTSWIISTRDPADMYKLRTKKGSSNEVSPTQSQSQSQRKSKSCPFSQSQSRTQATPAAAAAAKFKCPFSGMEIDPKDIPGIVVTSSSHQNNNSNSNSNSNLTTTDVNDGEEDDYIDEFGEYIKPLSNLELSVPTGAASNGRTGMVYSESPSIASSVTGPNTPYYLKSPGTSAPFSNTRNSPRSRHSNSNARQTTRGSSSISGRGAVLSPRQRRQMKTFVPDISSGMSANSRSWTEDDDLSEDYDEFDRSYSGNNAAGAAAARGGLSAAATRKLFPYHVILDTEFRITQVGPDLPKVLGTNEAILYGYEVDEVFEFVKPKPAKWTRSWLRKLEDQEFVLECTLESVPIDMFFKGTLVTIGPGEVMMILCPDAKNLEELRSMHLTLSDLPAHGAYRDAVFLREHLSRQMNDALKLEKLSRTLQTEKELLESLLPVHAAEGLRSGKAVEPMLHNNVTMFFSDIVGFTNICKEISPWQVIGMLNELYGIMDYLAKKFNLFKVETIGDAYVCCSGLPESDRNHAINVANFAIAVSKFCSRVKSPVDGSSIQLRIGIHSGPCASGIVGVTNPRYCVFGDTVNTTARHETTGLPGKVHCSVATMNELATHAPDEFELVSRGLVDMKGKGEQPTFWLKAKDSNPLVNRRGLKLLEKEIEQRFPSSATTINKNGTDILEHNVNNISKRSLEYTMSPPTSPVKASKAKTSPVTTSSSVKKTQQQQNLDPKAESRERRRQKRISQTAATSTSNKDHRGDDHDNEDDNNTLSGVTSTFSNATDPTEATTDVDESVNTRQRRRRSRSLQRRLSSSNNNDDNKSVGTCGSSGSSGTTPSRKDMVRLLRRSRRPRNSGSTSSSSTSYSQSQSQDGNGKNSPENDTTASVLQAIEHVEALVISNC